ncbi:MAG TPA: tyrosine-type recombinase/integrase [Acidimicrobiales bacterium]|nr:tyrosine-type recombinase/integrase [Acidimicrobiales bacterium]
MSTSLNMALIAASFSARNRLASYQRHLFLHRSAVGAPLSFRTQAQRLIATTKGFFAHLAAEGTTPYDLAAGIVLPKAEHRLPEGVLSAEEAEAVLAVPDTTTTLGLRDRAMLEVFYSSAIRRAELIALRVHDVDVARRTLFVRQGKGGRDRHVPVGSRALAWLRRYLDDARPQLVRRISDETLFLSSTGGRLAPDVVSRTVTAYVRAGEPGRKGSCHLFRHSTATLMLDNGADVRYVGELLGHVKLEATQLYTRVSIAKLRQVHAACHPAERGER